MQNERLRHLNENLLEELEKSKWELEAVKGQLQKLQKEAQLEQEQKDRWERAGKGGVRAKTQTDKERSPSS